MRDWRAEVRARLGRLTAVPIEPAHEADLVDELAAHLEDQFKELRARGKDPDEACATLLAELTDDALRDAVASWRAAHPSPPSTPIGAPAIRGEWLGTTWQDIRYGWRSLRRSPVFTIVAVLSLALGIGANTAIFGLLYSILLQRLALDHPEQVVALHRAAAAGSFDRFAYSEFEQLRQTTDAPRIEASYLTGVATVIRNTRDYLNADFVSGGFFTMVGVRPLLGRVLSREDERTAAAVVVLSENIEASAPGIRLDRIMGLEQALDDELARERLAAGLATVFGGLALVLAAVGLYGVVAYNVDRRTHEIGVRMALGARSADVLWLIVKQSLTLTGLGVVIGVPAALASAHSIASQLYGIRAGDPQVLFGSAMLLLVVGAAASALPGRRAARVDPIQALRAE